LEPDEPAHNLTVNAFIGKKKINIVFKLTKSLILAHRWPSFKMKDVGVNWMDEFLFGEFDLTDLTITLKRNNAALTELSLLSCCTLQNCSRKKIICCKTEISQRQGFV